MVTTAPTLAVAVAVTPSASVTRTVSTVLDLLPAVYSPVVAFMLPPDAFVVNEKT